MTAVLTSVRPAAAAGRASGGVSGSKAVPSGLLGRNVAIRGFVPIRRAACHATVPDAQAGPVVEAAVATTNQLAHSNNYDDAAAVAASPLLGRTRSPFFQPTVRALALGMGAGAALELLHVVTKLVFTAATSGATGPSLLSLMYPSLAPLMLWDHVAAIAVMLAVYMAEGPAMMEALRRNPNDLSSAAKAASNAITAPKALLSNLTIPALRRAFYKIMRGKSMQPAAGLATAERANSMGNAGDKAGGADGPARQNSSEMSPATSAPVAPLSRAMSAGSSVLDRPVEKKQDQQDRQQRPTGNNIVPGPMVRRGSSSSAPQAPPAPPINPREASRQKREKEIKDREAYLKNFWYVAALSQNLKDKPLKVDIMGRSVVLFRDEDGKPRCLDNACPHRGAPLSNGWTKEVKAGYQGSASKGGKCVVCPYHGWAFDKEGRLAEVPSNPAASSIPKRPMVDAYPVEEHGGFVWLFFGSKGMPAEERPPIPLIPELSDPKWKSVYGEIEFEAGHHSVFENAIDMAHIHYLHADSFGNSDKPVIMDMKVERDTFAVHANFRIHNKPVNPLWNWTQVESVPVQATAFLPSTSSVKITLAHGVQMITYVNTVPISPTRSINRFCLIRNFAQPDAFDPFARKAMMQILGEDKVMLDTLMPQNVAQEVSLEADLPQIAFRKLRQEWIDMGYGVPPDQVQGHHGSLTVDQ